MYSAEDARTAIYKVNLIQLVGYTLAKVQERVTENVSRSISNRFKNEINYTYKISEITRYNAHIMQIVEELQNLGYHVDWDLHGEDAYNVTVKW